ncbi:TerD family protein [Vibrio splendidus]
MNDQMTPTVSLTKGQGISLTKTRPLLKSVRAILGWRVRETNGVEFDLDVSAFLLNAEGKCRPGQLDVVMYNEQTQKHPSGSVIHGGDNLEGSTDGSEAEFIAIDLSLVPHDIQKIAFTVSIHEAKARGQNFGQVNNAMINIVDTSDNHVLATADLSEEHDVETAMIVGELYRKDQGWSFKFIDQGYAGGLMEMGKSYGFNFAP